MIIVLTGASGSGKSAIQNLLVKHYGYDKIVSFTTRNPRPGEIDDVDYHFITNDEFMLMDWAEYEMYSQDRFYGTLINDYQDDKDKVVVLTPNGVRQLIKNMDRAKFFIVYVNTDLGTRVKRYIDRCGVHNFNFDDKNEICARVERDFGMFLGIENLVDLVVTNDEGESLMNVVDKINRHAKEAVNEYLH